MANTTLACCWCIAWRCWQAWLTGASRDRKWRMTDDELLAGFENCTLPNEAFHHEEHVRVAFLYLRHYSALEALQHFSTALERFGVAHGKTTLYNETVTWAYLLLIRERMARAEWTQSWPEFRAG